MRLTDTEDLISRQAAIEAMFAEMPGLTFGGVLRVLRTLPSAQPEQKTGWCGARMGEEDETD